MAIYAAGDLQLAGSAVGGSPKGRCRMYSAACWKNRGQVLQVPKANQDAETFDFKKVVSRGSAAQHQTGVDHRAWPLRRAIGCFTAAEVATV
ncbi:MAG: hypothetical protein U0894_08995 [Pirellulales bacterium]